MFEKFYNYNGLMRHPKRYIGRPFSKKLQVFDINENYDGNAPLLLAHYWIDKKENKYQDYALFVSPELWHKRRVQEGEYVSVIGNIGELFIYPTNTNYQRQIPSIIVSKFHHKFF